MSHQKDALDTLGTKLPPGEEGTRDAIHLAVIQVVAGEWMPAGAHVHLKKNGLAHRHGMVGADKRIGIVDPFLPTGGVAEGETFWLILYPRTITGLRHVWSHPDFPESTE